MSARRSDGLGRCRLVDAELARKGGLCERNQYFLRSADRDLHHPAGSLDAQAKATDHRVSITKDVPILRIDYISIKGMLLGVRQVSHRREGDLSSREIERRLSRQSARCS